MDAGTFTMKRLFWLAGCQACLLLSLGVAPTASGQVPEESPGSVPGQDEAVEEIIVYGDLSLTQLQREVFRAEEAFLDTFNEITTNDEFKFRCEYVVSTGTRKRDHLCMPKFARDAGQRSAEEMMTTFELMGNALPGARIRPGMAGGYTFFPSRANLRELQETEARMWEEMSTLVRENDEMQRSLLALTKAKRAYESEKERRCRDQDGTCDE